MAATDIEWAQNVWNPVIGCSKVSAGCAHCYAERQAARLARMLPAAKRSGRGAHRLQLYSEVIDPATGHWNGQVRCDHSALDIVLRARRAKVWFVNSMGDLFHEAVPDAFIEWVFGVISAAGMRVANQFVILTKRAERMAAWASAHNVHANVWLGASIEDQRTADKRLPQLLKLAAAGWHTVVSAEPLLGPVDLTTVRDPKRFPGCMFTDALLGREVHEDDGGRWTETGRVGWVIVGGESGPGARPCDVAWIRSLRDQGRAAGVPVFHKQLGARCYGPDVHSAILRHPKGGDPSEWPEDLRVREYPPEIAAVLGADQ